jgi:hypothetical protein
MTDKPSMCLVSRSLLGASFWLWLSGSRQTMSVTVDSASEQAARDAAEAAENRPRQCPKCGSTCVVRRGLLLHRNVDGFDWSTHLPRESQQVKGEGFLRDGGPKTRVCRSQ